MSLPRYNVLFKTATQTLADAIMREPLPDLVQMLAAGAAHKQALSNAELNLLFMRAFSECGAVAAQVEQIRADVEALKTAMRRIGPE